MTSPAVPQTVGVQLAHATVQALADQHGLDVLHIKGPALDPALSPRDPDGSVRRNSSDADVWVRPRQVDACVAALTAAGWDQVVRFEDGSSFEHASTFWHRYLGYLDLHRTFPGITTDPAAAFDLLWAERRTVEIAARPCTVPALTAQRLIVVLHLARGAARAGDLHYAWSVLDAAGRAEVEALAARLGAEAALAVGTGRLDVSDPETELWKARTTPGLPLVEIWAARIRAQRTPWGKLRVAVRQVLPNRRRMEFAKGRRVTRREMVRAYADRARAGAGELLRLWRARRERQGRGGSST